MSGSTEPQIHSDVRDKWLAVTLRHVVTWCPSVNIATYLWCLFSARSWRCSINANLRVINPTTLVFSKYVEYFDTLKYVSMEITTKNGVYCEELLCFKLRRLTNTSNVHLCTLECSVTKCKYRDDILSSSH